MITEEQQKSLKSILIILGILLILGTVSFAFLRGLSPWTAFYETLHLMLSHFYDYNGERETPLIQLTSLMLISGSLIIVVYLFKIFGDYLLGGQLKEKIKRKNMDKVISRFKDHYIICGYGRVGRQVAEEFCTEGIDFVVIDRDKEVLKIADKKGYNYILGDPTDDQNIIAANIKEAKGLLAVLDDDTDNLFLTIAAKGENSDIFIVARASNEENIKKFEKAGANRVALPYKIGGYHIATMALRPSVVDFLDIMVDGKHNELQVEELCIQPENDLIGKTIAESDLSKNKIKTTVLAVNKSDGRSIINPKGNYEIELNDKLIVLGTKEHLEMVAEKIQS